jgi:putative resolvase
VEVQGGRGKVDGNCEEEKVVLYGGVSSRKDELAKQVKYLEENFVEREEEGVPQVTEDDSKQRSVESRSLPGQAGEVRLRDGRGGMQSAHNCELVVLNKEDNTTGQELIDLISILVSFGKLYGMGSREYEKVRKCLEEIKA